MSTKPKRLGLFGAIKRYPYFYILLLPSLIYLIIFNYIPMYGITLAFRQFAFNRPSMFGEIPILRFIGQTFNMEWVGLQWFEFLFALPDFWVVMRNTMIISFGRLIIEFPAPIILALLLNEVRIRKLKAAYQTVFTFPHFLSWVLVVGMLNGIFQTTGVINQALISLDKEPIRFLTDPQIFRGLLFSTNIWKSAGWGSIIYLAAIAGIDPTLYEAAMVDGAKRIHCLWHITLPCIKSTIVIMVILTCGNILNAGFDQIFNMYNPAVYSTADVLDTWIFRTAFQSSGSGARSFSLTIATGTFKAVCNFALLLSANLFAKRLGEEGLI